MSLFLTMCLFALAMSVSPGPTNFITLSTGANHGFRKTMPFVSGATAGFTVLLAAIGLGLGSIAVAIPYFMTLLAYGGSAFICYTGYKLAMSRSEISIANNPPASFRDGIILQWLNPKAWTACFAGVSAFNLTNDSNKLGLFLLLYFVICYVSIAAWGLAGARARHYLLKPKTLTVFNRLMGSGLVLVSVYLLILQQELSL